MLENIFIRNFQCHHNLVIELGQITSVTGKTDSGKTAILRALRWLCHNRPSGDAFLTKGQDSCRAELIVDGKKIVRKKGKENAYYLNGKKFKAFAGAVPDEIAAILNLGPENWQRQHDQAYWLSLPASQVSKELNRIVNLGTIDAALSGVAAELRKAKSAVEISEERLKEAEKQEKELRWIEKADSEFQELERKKSENDLRETRILFLRDTIIKGEGILRDRKTAGEAAKEGQELLDKWEHFVAVNEMMEGLVDLIGTIEGMEKRWTETSQKLEKAEKELKRKMKGKCPLCGNTNTF